MAPTLPNEPPAATEPPEIRGAGRDDVRMLVAGPEGIMDTTFGDLPAHIQPGDVLVVNVSATVPASLPAAEGLRLHVSTELPGGYHAVEVRVAEGPGSRPLHVDPPPALRLGGGGTARILGRYPAGRESRLHLALLDLDMEPASYLAAHGEPIRYAYVTKPWPIDAYQTVFAQVPGSAEMPSAARAFTHRMVTRLVAGGVTIAPIVLHTGVSSLEAGEPPYPEWYSVPPATAHLVAAGRERGSRIIAVGTTVVRALETTTSRDGATHPGSGWTDHIVDADTGVVGVDGLLTGWHAPESSHLAMLEAIGGEATVAASYGAALAGGYLWHEFGDLHLLWRPESAARLRAA